jgi:hypothetical protein
MSNKPAWWPNYDKPAPPAPTYGPRPKQLDGAMWEQYGQTQGATRPNKGVRKLNSEVNPKGIYK